MTKKEIEIKILIEKLEQYSGKKVSLIETKSNIQSNIEFSDKYSGKEIFANKESVGYFYFIKKITTKDKFLSEFDYDKNLVSFFKTNNIPNKFTSIEVTTLEIDKEHRGKGYAKKALEKAETSNSVMYLEIGSSKSDNIDEKSRIEIYSHMGFTIFTVKNIKLKFAIKYIP